MFIVAYSICLLLSSGSVLQSVVFFGGWKAVEEKQTGPEGLFDQVYRALLVPMSFLFLKHFNDFMHIRFKLLNFFLEIHSES